MTMRLINRMYKLYYRKRLKKFPIDTIKLNIFHFSELIGEICNIGLGVEYLSDLYYSALRHRRFKFMGFIIEEGRQVNESK